MCDRYHSIIDICGDYMANLVMMICYGSKSGRLRGHKFLLHLLYNIFYRLESVCLVNDWLSLVGLIVITINCLVLDNLFSLDGWQFDMLMFI